jgi:hypothetical protein
MATASGQLKHAKIEIFIEYNDGQRLAYEMQDEVADWGTYVEANIRDIGITAQTAKVGVTVTAPKKAWGHLDDWSLVKLD